MKKDYIPLWIAVASGFFSVLSTVADNLTKNIVVQKVIQESKSVANTKHFDFLNFAVQNQKPIFFATISIVGIVIFLIIKLRKKTRRTKR